MHWTTIDEGQATMAVASGVLRERKEKGKGTRSWREGKANVKEEKEKNDIFVHSQLNCPKNLSFENLSQKSFKPLF